MVCRADGFADPYRTTTAYYRAAQAQGVAFHIGDGVMAVKRNGAGWRVETSTETFTADIVVNCAGAWADKIAAMVGDFAPVAPSAPMMIVTEPIKHFLDPVVGMVGRKLSFKQAPNGTVVIAALQSVTPTRRYWIRWGWPPVPVPLSRSSRTWLRPAWCVPGLGLKRSCRTLFP